MKRTNRRASGFLKIVAFSPAITAVMAAAAAACVGGGKPADYGNPTLPSDPAALYLKVEEPADFAESADAEITVKGIALAGDATPPVLLTQGAASVAVPSSEQRFETKISLVHGENTLRIAAVQGEKRAEIVRRVTYVGDKPGLAWLTPASTAPVGGATVVASVKTSSAQGRSITGVKMSAGAAEALATRSGDTWTASIPLATSGAEVTLTAVATDSAGDGTLATRVFKRDGAAPSINLSTPRAGEIFAVTSVEVTGTADDDVGVARVTIRVDGGDPEPAVGTTSWTARVALDPGDHTIVATVFDVSGQEASASVSVTVSRVVTLRPPNTTGDITLALDANGLKRLIPVANQKTLTMLYVDLGPVLSGGLAAIKSPETHGVDTSAWGPAERNMQRLLLMSPDNADLRGTSLEDVLTLAPNLGLPPARLLADIGGVTVDSPFLSESDVSSAIIRNLIETHPNIDTDPVDGKKKVRASLYDAFNDFSTLGPRFGACSTPTTECPAGAQYPTHPGFLVGGTLSRALRNNFKMTVTARSNLTSHDGINPDTGKAYLFVPRDPTRSATLDFDFIDPARFQVEGIADAPTVDMTFFMNESPQAFVASGTQTSRPDGIFFKGGNAAWDASPWFIEHLVIDGIYQSKRARFADASYTHVYRYDVGAIRPAATMSWEKGWISTVTAGGLGNPPRPAYFWDHLLEAAQKRLHDNGVAEGQARVQFAMKGIPLGLSGAQLKEKLRPQMEAQKADLSNILLGDRTTYRSAVTFFLAKGQNNQEFLYFTAAGDIPGASPYPYSKPGFYSDAAFTTKASSTASGGSGDTLHEKVPATAPATFFIRGINNKDFKVELLDRNATGLRVRVVPVTR